jgi:cytochrome oxidase Cu insertion factor (SCO1/SenC/PrrC family)
LQRLIRLFLFLLLLGTVGLTACGGDNEDDNNGNQDSDNETSGLNVGDEAPDFSLPAVDGGDVSLADYTGRQPVLLYFHMAVG